MSSLLKSKNIYVIFSITLISVMGVASLTPAFPTIAESLNLTKTQVGLLISVFTLPGVFMTPVMGVFADRFGRKKVLVPSLFLFAIAGFGGFIIHDFHTLLILRFFQGLGAASLGSLNTTLVGDLFKGPDRPAAMGLNASVLSLSTAFYPLIGGALAGIAWYYPFLLPLLAIPVGLFVIYMLDEPVFDKSGDFKAYLKATRQSIARREVVAVFFLSILTFLILYGAFLTYMPFLLDAEFGLSAAKIGMLLSASSITSALIASQMGKLTVRFGGKALLTTAFATYLLVCLMIPNIHSLSLFFLPILLYGAAQALNMPSLQTMLANLAPDQQRGIFMSINGMVLRIGQTIGPLTIGIGYAMDGLRGAYYLGAGFALIGLILIRLLLNRNLTK